LYFMSDGPHEGGEFSSDCGDNEIRVLPFGDESLVPFTQAQLCLPGDVLDGRREGFKAKLNGTGDFRRVTVGPCAFDEYPARMTVARLGDTAEASFAAAGVLAGDESEVGHQLPGIVEAGEISYFRDDGDGYGEPDAAKRLEGLHDGREPPGRGTFMELGLEMGHAFRVLGDSVNIFLEDDLLGRCRADDRCEPSQVCLAPVRRAAVADVEAQEQGFETRLGSLQITHCILSCATKIPYRLVFEPGYINGGQIARAHEAGQLNGIASVGLDTVSRFAGDQRRSDHVTLIAFLGEVPIETVPAGTSFIDEDELLRLGLQPADELVDIPLAGTDATDKYHLGTAIVGRIGDRDKILMTDQTDEKRAILLHVRPPWLRLMVRTIMRLLSLRD